MEAAMMRKREKQLAKATRTMREVAESIEALVRNGPIALTASDFLEFSAKLLSARHAILTEDGPCTHVAARKRASTASVMLNVQDSSALMALPRVHLPN